MAQTAGPALAGVLIRALGAPVAVLVDAASYVFCAPIAGFLATGIGTRASLLVAAGVFALAVVVLAASPVRQANIMEPR